MKFLQTEFEDQLLASIDDEGIINIGDLALSPAQYLAADPTAYRSQYTSWLYEDWYNQQDEILQELLTIHANEKRFSELCLALNREYVVPFIGSGMSAPSGLPTWSNFLRFVRKFSPARKTEGLRLLSAHALERLLIKGSFEEAVDRLMKSMNTRLFNERVAHDLSLDDAKEVRGAILLLPYIFPKLVLTINLDQILERLYNEADLAFGERLVAANIHQFRALMAGSSSMLLKLHGDSQSVAGRVLNSQEYDNAYGTNGTVRTELELIFRTKVLLFLGCSLNDDRFVQIITEMADQDPDIPKHYCFLKLPDDDNDRLDRENSLTASGVYPIWYNGDHDASILALLVGMQKSINGLEPLEKIDIEET